MSDTNPKHTPILRDEETLYVLGHDGSNEWSAGVQSAWHDRHWRIAKATELHAALIEHAALKARCEAMRAVLERSLALADDVVEERESDEFDGPSHMLAERARALSEDIAALLSPRDGEAK